VERGEGDPRYTAKKEASGRLAEEKQAERGRRGRHRWQNAGQGGRDDQRQSQGYSQANADRHVGGAETGEEGDGRPDTGEDDERGEGVDAQQILEHATSAALGDALE
jgi:hypothetical protein